MTYPGGWRPHLESALCLDVWHMHREGYLRDGVRGVWGWKRDGDAYASISCAVSLRGEEGALTLNYMHTKREGKPEAVKYDVRLSSIPLHYGGRRWYAHCPYTGRRARKLYKFSSVERFCHRMSIRPLPTYAIQRESGMARIQAQRWALRRKLSDESSDLYDEPLRPKRMHWRTFEKYAARDAELAERENIALSGFFARVVRKTGGPAY